MVTAPAVLAAVGTNSIDLGSALVALAVFLGISGLSKLRVSVAEELVPRVHAPVSEPRSNTGFPESLLASIGRSHMARRFGDPVRLRRQLELAGDPMSIQATLGLKLVGTTCVGGLVLVLGLAAGDLVHSIALSVAIGAGASRILDFVLARLVRRRQLRIAAQVPDLAELLLATTGAGLNPSLAFRRSAEVLDGPLGEELRTAVRGSDLGTPWRAVLDGLAERTGDVAIRRLVRAMGRSQRLGTSLSSALLNVAEDLRSERQTRAEELARRAPVKMLFPLVFLILPAFLLLTVGPVLLATLRSLH